jgi:hypothetical protein
VCTKEKGKENRKGSAKPDIAYQITLKCVDNIAFRTMHCSQTNTQPMAMKEALVLGTGAREPGCEQTRKDDQATHTSSYCSCRRQTHIPNSGTTPLQTTERPNPELPPNLHPVPLPPKIPSYSHNHGTPTRDASSAPRCRNGQRIAVCRSQ